MDLHDKVFQADDIAEITLDDMIAAYRNQLESGSSEEELSEPSPVQMSENSEINKWLASTP